jgi:flavin-dependent dehydrogenase
MSEPIRILGAGHAGLSAAINLSKAGYPVEVYDRQRDVGMRFHNDTEGLENWSKKIDALDDDSAYKGYSYLLIAGGVGHFSNSCRFSKNGQIYIGEAAGLQDLLGGTDFIP